MPPKNGLQNGSKNVNGKRKLDANSNSAPARKRFRAIATRRLNVQSHDDAFSNGSLNVADFVKAREFEIQALENGIKSSSRALSSRAFQEVPRELRRRTASHNAKRVPKRLQARALREMRDDNTVVKRRKKILPHQRMRIETIKRMRAMTERLKAQKEAKKAKRKKTVTDEDIEVIKDDDGDANMVDQDANVTKIKVQKPKPKKTNQLSNPPVPAAKFRKRQIEKTWLPTHVYHAKRAHMSSPGEPLWRFAIPLTPTEKSYRKTHRATTLRGAIAWDTSYVSTIGLRGREDSIIGLLKALGIGAYNVDSNIWGRKGSRWRNGSRTWSGWLHKRDLHPSGTICPVDVIWEPAKMKPDVDNHLDTSSSEKTIQSRNVWVRCHPSAFLELWQQLLQLAKIQKPSIKVEDLRYEIGSIKITGPQASEVLAGVLMPKTHGSTNAGSHDALDRIWKVMPTLDNINIFPSNVLLPLSISDPRLRRRQKSSAPNTPRPPNTQEMALDVCLKWPLDEQTSPVDLFDKTVRAKACQLLLTQKAINRRRSAVLPGQTPAAKSEDPSIPLVMYSSNAGNANQGSWTLMLPWKCLLAVWYPIMYVPLSTGGNVRFGGLEEMRQIAYESQRPWFPADFPGTKAGQAWELRTQEDARKQWNRKPKGRRTEYESIDLGRGRIGEIGRGWACDWEALSGDSRLVDHIPAATARDLMSRTNSMTDEMPAGLVTVKITMITRGVPQTRARIYRLPTNDDALRRKWLLLAARKNSQHLKSIVPQIGSDEYPVVPDKEDLVGFVTTGNFSLSEGLGFGIGSIALAKIIGPSVSPTIPEVDKESECFICIVRNAGDVFGRVAYWVLAE